VGAAQTGKMENFELDDNMTHQLEWIGLNAIWAGWTVAMMSNAITWGLGIVGGITLIWFNIERALTARKQRAMYDKKLTENEENA
jgi:hypothetical protein